MFIHASWFELLTLAGNIVAVLATFYCWVERRRDYLVARRQRDRDAPDRVEMAKDDLRNEYVSLVHKQLMLLVIGVLRVCYPPPPFVVAVTVADHQAQRLAAVISLILLWIAVRTAWNSVIRVIDRIPITTVRRDD